MPSGVRRPKKRTRKKPKSRTMYARRPPFPDFGIVAMLFANLKINCFSINSQTMACCREWNKLIDALIDLVTGSGSCRDVNEQYKKMAAVCGGDGQAKSPIDCVEWNKLTRATNKLIKTSRLPRSRIGR